MGLIVLVTKLYMSTVTSLLIGFNLAFDWTGSVKADGTSSRDSALSLKLNRWENIQNI